MTCGKPEFIFSKIIIIIINLAYTMASWLIPGGVIPGRRPWRRRSSPLCSALVSSARAQKFVISDQHLGCKFSLCELIVKVVVAEFGANALWVAVQIWWSWHAKFRQAFVREFQRESEESPGAESSRAPDCSAALRHHACHAVVASLGVSPAAHIWAQSRRVPILLWTAFEDAAMAAPIAGRRVPVTAG